MKRIFLPIISVLTDQARDEKSLRKKSLSVKWKFTNFTLEVIYTRTIYEKIDIYGKLKTNLEVSLF